LAGKGAPAQAEAVRRPGQSGHPERARERLRGIWHARKKERAGCQGTVYVMRRSAGPVTACPLPVFTALKVTCEIAAVVAFVMAPSVRATNARNAPPLQTLPKCGGGQV